MARHHTLLCGLAAAAMLLTAGAPAMAQDRDPGVRDYPTEAPPAPRSERVRPRRGYVWIAGNYEWRNGAWTWIPGHWEREQRGRVWRQGRWSRAGDRYTWQAGSWREPAPYPDEPPPPPRDENRRRRRGFVWIEGNYEWRNGVWVWVDGHLERDRAGMRWNAGRWDRDGDTYRWRAGDWVAEAPPPPLDVRERIPVRGRVERGWKRRGWVDVGAVNVHGVDDHDTMIGRIGAQPWRALAINVLNADLDLYDVVLRLPGGRAYSPDLKHRFAPGERTIVIDLPPGAELIQSIDFRYGRERGEGKARIQVWALK